TRNQCGNRVAFGKKRDVRIVHMIDVIERCGVEAQQVLQRGSCELRNVRSYRQSIPPRGLKYAKRIFLAESPAITKHIHKLRQPALHGLRNHLLTDKVNVVTRLTSEFKRDCMCS